MIPYGADGLAVAGRSSGKFKSQWTLTHAPMGLQSRSPAVGEKTFRSTLSRHGAQDVERIERPGWKVNRKPRWNMDCLRVGRGPEGGGPSHVAYVVDTSGGHPWARRDRRASELLRQERAFDGGVLSVPPMGYWAG